MNISKVAEEMSIIPSIIGYSESVDLISPITRKGAAFLVIILILKLI